MSQNIEKFYGVKLIVSKDIELEKYENARKKMDKALKDLQTVEGHEYGVYVSRLEFLICQEKVFGIGPLSERLSQAVLKLSVNKKEKEGNKIIFLNEKLPQKEWLLSQDVEIKANKNLISAKLNGEYCQNNSTFELLVLTCVRKDVPVNRRKLKLSTIAHPTENFSRKFKNIDGKVKTDLDYMLENKLQLLIHFTY